MRCVGGLVSWSGLFAAFLLFVSVMCVSGDENCFKEVGDGFEFKGTCPGVSEKTITAPSKSYSIVLDHPGPVAKSSAFKLNVAGCDLTNSYISEDPTRNTSVLNVNGVTYDFLATITVNDTEVTIDGSGKHSSICSKAHFDDISGGGGFSSKVAIDLANTAIPSFLMTIKVEKPEASTDDETNQAGTDLTWLIIVGCCVLGVIAVLVIGGLGYYFKFYKPRKEKETENEEEKKKISTIESGKPKTPDASKAASTPGTTTAASNTSNTQLNTNEAPPAIPTVYAGAK